MKKENKKPKLVIFVIALVIFLALIQLFVSHRLATAGELISSSEKKAKELEKVNRQMKGEISQMGSLAKIASRAADLGLNTSPLVLHLTPQVPVALGK